MSLSLRLPVEKVVLALTSAAVIAGGIWWWRAQPELQRLRAAPTAAVLADAPYTRAEAAPASLRGKPWPKPAAQSHGPGWIYEVFTPPVIYYHTLARSFSVTPPMLMADGASPFGLELIDVTREPFRLQLVGYVGSPGNYVAAFVSPKSPETFLARTGRKFAELGLTLKDFSVRKVNVPNDEDWSVYDVAGLAVIVDERSGEEITLDSRSRRLTDTPLAVLRLGSATKPREFREGEIFQDETATYRIDRIQLDPPEVVIAKQVNGLPYPETRVLKPAIAEKVARKKAAPSKPFQERTSDIGVAHADPRP